jgi:hypothetical protein
MVKPCHAMCPICDSEWGEDEKTEAVTPRPATKTMQCQQSDKAHKGMHHCKKHVWGTEVQWRYELAYKMNTFAALVKSHVDHALEEYV